jgi:hypothetical protein
MTYHPRQMPRRYMEGAPASVRAAIVDIIAIKPAAPLDFDIVFRDVYRGQMSGLDFGADGARGCHFFLDIYQMRAYRARNRRKRTAWLDLPEDARRAIVRYVEEPA